MTDTELKDLLVYLSGCRLPYVKSELRKLSDQDLILMAAVYEDEPNTGRRPEIIRLRILDEILLRNGFGKVRENQLKVNQKELLESFGLTFRKKRLFPEPLFDELDNIIINYLKKGFDQKELSAELQKKGYRGVSLSSIEKRLSAIRKHYKAKTMFHLAVVLYGDKLILQEENILL